MAKTQDENGDRPVRIVFGWDVAAAGRAFIRRVHTIDGNNAVNANLSSVRGSRLPGDGERVGPDTRARNPR